LSAGEFLALELKLPQDLVEKRHLEGGQYYIECGGAATPFLFKDMRSGIISSACHANDCCPSISPNHIPPGKARRLAR
jgi:hypothetical protein